MTDHISGSRSRWKFSGYARKVWMSMPPECLHIVEIMPQSFFLDWKSYMCTCFMFNVCIELCVYLKLKLLFHVKLPVQLFNILRTWIIPLNFHSGGILLKNIVLEAVQRKHFYTIMANRMKRRKRKVLIQVRRGVPIVLPSETRTGNRNI